MIIKEIERTEHSIRRQHAHHHSGVPIIQASGLTVSYPGGDALRDVNFSVARTTRLAVLGPNGAGKSTLIKAIAGVITPSSGAVEVFGEAPGEHICIAYVPQRTQVDWNFPVSVRDVVMMGRASKLGLLRRPARTDWQAVDRALAEVRLEKLARRQISELSGGQQQRMFIARALAQEAELMLMDEPFTGLDTHSQSDIFDILDALRDRRVTVLVALHDLKLAADYFDAAMLLNRKLVAYGVPQEIFTPANLAEAYGSRFQDREDWLAMDDTCCGDGDHSHDQHTH